MKKFFFLIALLFSLNGYASTFMYQNGNELLKKINSSNVSEKLLGTGYIIGVIDAKLFKCDWTNIQLEQLVDSVKKYLENNPNLRHFNAASIVENVLRKDYNCRWY